MMYADAMGLAAYLNQVDLSLDRSSGVLRGDVADYFARNSAPIGQVIAYVASLSQPPAAAPPRWWLWRFWRLVNVVRRNPIVDHASLGEIGAALREVADYLAAADAPTDGAVYPLRYRVCLACMAFTRTFAVSDEYKSRLVEHLHQNDILRGRLRPFRDLAGERWPYAGPGNS
ncbi:hypothetical protein [Lysobacter enzymogenes]|uniref:hypothetical protein n=1 Tax=Lysobacter enzymogenes TaxID=69 RepID=UPI001A976CB4|nr:hypothetical protein [Lysobacter enzymogenes]QQP96079.1 hypothetical protein JHW38_23175 [Lysobacter enzymogenes]